MAPLSASYITVQSFAFQVNAQGKHNSQQFDALCGDNPPQIVDGYGRWQVINRPLRQGLTIPQGFNPAKVKIEIRFGIWNGQFGWDGWDTGHRTKPPYFDHRASQRVEADIDNLHWMAGGNELGGPSPIVYIDSFRLDRGRQVRSNLMPKQYRGIPWIIDSGVNWNASIRDRYGARIYQEADFTVMGYTAPAGSARPPVQQSRMSGGLFKTTPQARTALAIAFANSSDSVTAYLDSLARNILKNHRNNPCKGTRLHLERRSINWNIPVGIDVWVPSHSI